MENIKDRLILLIEKTDGSRKKTAHLLGISEGYLSQLTSGDRKPSVELAKKIQAAFVAKPIQILDVPLRKLPVVSWTTAGSMTSYEDLANQIDELVDSTTHDPNAFVVEVDGDSMEREVHHGDLVVLEPNRQAATGDMAYVRLTDEAGGGGTLKWFYRTGPQGRVIKLVAENPDWPATEHPIQMVQFAYPVHNIIRRRPKRRL